MKLRNLCFVVAILSAPSLLAPAHGQESRIDVAAASSTRAPTQSTSEDSKEVEDEAARQAAQKRREIVQDAVDALRETKNALAALDRGNSADALRALAAATGKLELVVARDPNLALAPVDATFRMMDVYTSPATVRAAVDRAGGLLDDEKVQDARSLISDLASEIVITETNLPLATYPAAIKAVTPTIDNGRIEEAKRALQVALSTLVLVDTILPLPPLRAAMLLEDAEMLAEKSSRSAEENDRLASHLAAARTQLELGAALGYGDKAAFEGLYKELDEIEDKTANGQSGRGLFDRVKDSIQRVFS